MSITRHMPMRKASVRRYEMFTGAGRRRSFTAADKAAIVAESYGDDNSVSGIARQHGLTPSQLFAWRRQARESGEPWCSSCPPLFVPALIEAAVDVATPTPTLQPIEPTHRSCVQDGMIEVELEGIWVRIGRDARPETVVSVLRALRDAS